MHSSTLYVISALGVVGGQCYSPAALLPGKRTGTHFTGGWVSLRVHLDGCKNLTTTGIRSQYRPSHSESQQ